MADYHFDLFISYKSEQRSWARRLAETLAGFGLDVWWDRDDNGGIPGGRPWGSSIDDAIRASRKMAVLWSGELAQGESTVHQEIHRMKFLIQSEPGDGRGFLPISLDGTPTDTSDLLKTYQQAASFEEQYGLHGAEGADAVSSIYWSRPIKDIARALGIEDIAELRFVVAAMNRSQAHALDSEPDTVCRDAEAYRALRRVMEETNSLLPDRYGDSPNAWKPFPELDENIVELLGRYDLGKRQWLLERKEQSCCNWLLTSYSEEFLSENGERWQAAERRLREGPCLVLIDPVSLLHRHIYRRMIVDLAPHRHHEAFVIGVSPYSPRLHDAVCSQIKNAEEHLKQLLGLAYERIRSDFDHEPRICVFGVDHDLQFTRWLQAAADRIYDSGRTPLRRRQRLYTRPRRERNRPTGSNILNIGGPPR